jgi:hypothetical protein
MDVFFQQEGAVGPLLFSFSLIASLLFLLIPYLIWKIVARLKQNGEKLQEINDRLARVIETLTPEATLSPLTDQNEPAEQNQVPFNFEEDSEVATVDENPEAETALNNATDSIPPTDADDDLFEFDIPDHFESTDNTERYDSNETSGGTETSETADDFGKTEESDLGEAFDHTDDLTDGDTVEESDERAPTSPSDNFDDKENLTSTADFENNEEFDLSEAFDPTDDLDTADDFNFTKEESDDNEFATTDLQEGVTAAALSLDTDFGKDIDATEFASGPDHEFAFEFDEELGELAEPDPISLNDSAPLSFDTTAANFTGEEFESEESSFTFETEDDSTTQAMDEFPDIDFTEDASIDFDTTEIETENVQVKPSFDEFTDTDFTATADRNNESDDNETDSDAKDQSQGLAETTIERESFVAPTKETIKEADSEDFAAAFDEIETSLSSESLDDIAESILKDQEPPAPIEIEPAPSVEIKPEPIPKIVPEPAPIPEISPEPQPAPKPTTLFARCEGCNHKLAYKETLSGKRVRCPACSVAFKLP